MGSLKVLLKTALSGIFLMFFTSQLYSQSNNITQTITIVVPQVLLVNAVDSTGNISAISLELTTNVAGTKLQSASGTSYAQVASIVASGQTRTIQASYNQIPVGTTLAITGVLPSSGDGQGTFGTSAGTIILSTTAQNIFTGIGSCYTGIAAKDGYGLDWQFNTGAQGTYSSVTATTGFTTTVTFTITAGS